MASASAAARVMQRRYRRHRDRSDAAKAERSVQREASRTAGNAHRDMRSWPVLEVLRDRKKRLSWAMSFHFGFLNILTILRHSAYGTFLTGNTINAASALSKVDLVSVGFYYTVIACYLLGQALYRVIDTRLYARTSAGAVAPLVFLLYTLTDVIDFLTTDGAFSRGDADALGASRWSVLPIAVGAGCVSACGAHLDGVVTNMITGHYATIVGSYASYYAQGRQLAHARKRACIVSIGCVIVFTAGAALSAVIAHNAGTDWQMTALGVLAAVLLAIHDYVHKDTLDRLKRERRRKLMAKNLNIAKFAKRLQSRAKAGGVRV